VAAYLASGVALPAAARFNATGRAYPDVAALAGQGNGYCVAYKGEFLKVPRDSIFNQAGSLVVGFRLPGFLFLSLSLSLSLSPYEHTTAGPLSDSS
jgi:hypothetical protein